MMIGPKGMAYNGHDLSPWLYANPTRPIMPPVEVEADKVPGMQGTRFRSAKLGELKIPVTVRLRASAKDNIAELRHALAAMLRSDRPAPLYLGDDPTRYNLAVLDGSSDLDRLWHTGRTELTFRACDPVSYGKRASLEIGAEGTANVGGTEDTSPTITATPPKGASYRIALSDTGEYVQVDMPFDGSAKLVIDCAAQHCTVNGASADAHVALASDYFILRPGNNRIVSSGGAATIEWTERWL